MLQWNVCEVFSIIIAAVWAGELMLERTCHQTSYIFFLSRFFIFSFHFFHIHVAIWVQLNAQQNRATQCKHSTAQKRVFLYFFLSHFISSLEKRYRNNNFSFALLKWRKKKKQEFVLCFLDNMYFKIKKRKRTKKCEKDFILLINLFQKLCFCSFTLNVACEIIKFNIKSFRKKCNRNERKKRRK